MITPARVANINIPKIIVSRKTADDKTNMKEKVSHFLTIDKHIQTKFINDEITITCMNAESAVAAEKCLSTYLANLYNINKEALKNPIVKIIGVENNFGMHTESIENDINTRNFSKFDSQTRVLHIYENTKKKTYTVILEVSAEIHKYIKDNKGKVFVGHQNCKTYDGHQHQTMSQMWSF